MARFVNQLLDAFHARTPIRAGSLIITLFGDAVVPRGGQLSLVSLFEIMRAFRINDGLVRTALSRLVADGWFERWKVGRNSHYRLTECGRAAFVEATTRIYGAPTRAWSGRFNLLVLQGPEERAVYRAELEESGYGVLTPDLLVGLDGSGKDPEGSFLRLYAQAPTPEEARRLAARAWPLQEIAERYERFGRQFEASSTLLENQEPVADLEALVIRTLVIHEYRRIVLRDPLLPLDLLPSPSAGAKARALCGRIYRAVLPAAERWLDRHACDDRGALPPPDSHLLERFGDLGSA